MAVADWVYLTDTATGCSYYANLQTRETSWHRPAEPSRGPGLRNRGRTVVESSGKCRMRTTALNAHPPCAEDTGRAGAQAPGVRVLCRNPYSRSQRTPCPAPPPAQSRRREVGGREGRHTPRDRVVVEVEDPRRATATDRPGGRPSHFHGWRYVAIPATTCSGAGGGRRRRGGSSGTARGGRSGTAQLGLHTARACNPVEPSGTCLLYTSPSPRDS